MRFEIVMLVSLMLAFVVEGTTRRKREGFGPWEAQDTWDEKGKSNVIETGVRLVQELVREFNASEAVIMEIVDAVEHPIRTLCRTWSGTILLGCLFVLLLAAALTFVSWTVRIFMVILRLFKGFGRVLCLILGPLAKPAKWIGEKLSHTWCLTHACALAPFLSIRSAYYRLKQRRNIECTETLIEIPRFTRIDSELKTDERGAYLTAGSVRVYFRTVDDLSNAAVINSKRDQGVATASIVKEAIIAGSNLYHAKELPAFQGQFTCNGKHVGFFSRITFRGKDCLLTAYHVYEYNKNNLSITKGDKTILLASVPARVVAFSPTEALDYLIVELPGAVFSKLGVKKGEYLPRVTDHTAIRIVQLWRDPLTEDPAEMYKPCQSQSIVRKGATNGWKLEYGASTEVGASGAPILTMKGKIIGVHLEHDTIRNINVGVVPPPFRATKKESATNEDVMDDAPDATPLTFEEYESRRKQQEEEDDERERLIDEETARNEELYTFYKKQVELGRRLEDQKTSWAAEMDEIDDLTRAAMKKDGKSYATGWEIYETYTGSAGKHVGRMIKANRVRKESPWSCIKCGHVHDRRGLNCEVCSWPLIKMKAQAAPLNPVIVSRVNEVSAELAAAKWGEDEASKKWMEQNLANSTWGDSDKEAFKEELVKTVYNALTPLVEEIKALRIEAGASAPVKESGEPALYPPLPAVSLNPSAPLPGGAPTTSGSSHTSSPQSQQSSAVVASSSKARGRRRKAKSGSKPKSSTQVLQNTGGLPEEQKQKPSASSSNAIVTKQKGENQPRRK